MKARAGSLARAFVFATGLGCAKWPCPGRNTAQSSCR